jgi:hypothetical protein
VRYQQRSASQEKDREHSNKGAYSSANRAGEQGEQQREEPYNDQQNPHYEARCRGYCAHDLYEL